LAAIKAPTTFRRRPRPRSVRFKTEKLKFKETKLMLLQNQTIFGFAKEKGKPATGS